MTTKYWGGNHGILSFLSVFTLFTTEPDLVYVKIDEVNKHVNELIYMNK